MKAALFLLVLALFSCALASDLEITRANRIYDIQAEFLHFQTNYTFHNKESAQPASSVRIPLEFSKEKISTMRFGAADVKLAHTFDESAMEYIVQLPTPLQPGKSLDLIQFGVAFHMLSFLPKEIAQAEKQYCVLEHHVLLASPYAVKEQTTSVSVHTDNVLSESADIEPHTFLKDQQVLALGPFSEGHGSSEAKFRVHFECNYPFLTASHVVQDARVSHWGTVEFEEHYEIRNSGAKLKGFFSRFDLQRQPYSAPHAVFGVRALLPSYVRNVYYRDEIGNISSSRMNATKHGVELDLVPRFPLFGGWKVPFYIGYQVPLSLFRREDKTILPLRPALFHAAVDSFELRLALPEGARNIEILSDLGDATVERTKTHGFLELLGRPTLVIRTRNVIPALAGHLEMRYSYNPIFMLLKFAIAFGYLLALIALGFASKAVLSWFSLRSHAHSE
eukprot:gnl/Trimastix_PCT/1594.p1 GENE.gnl/Trimastix_PCT/1594~~gnl/Trimastix_PCT/1594.p1  ORF type:complete len:449 (-),score=159.84 gnl/Trimastix_PCT/1594:20-1366(-)